MKGMIALIDLQHEAPDSETDHYYGVILPYERGDKTVWVAEVYRKNTGGLVATIEDDDMMTLMPRLDILLRLHEHRAYGSME